MKMGLDLSLSYKNEQMYRRKDVYRKRNRNSNIVIEIETVIVTDVYPGWRKRKG